MAELYHVIPGTVIEEVNCYWGPDPARFNTDPNCSLSVGQPVTILWREGNYYYVKYTAGGVEKRTYYMYDCIEIPYSIDTAPTVHTPSNDIVNYRYVIADPVVNPNVDLNVRYAPNGNAPVAGSLSTLERVNFVATVDGFSLVDYEVTGQNGKRKRAWIQNDRIAALPFPTDELYAKTQRNGYIGETNAEINARYFYDCFIALGFTPQAACALLGNIHQECSMNPAKWVINSKTDADVYGIFQWDAASKYLNRAVQQGLIDVATIDAIQQIVNENNAEVVVEDGNKVSRLIISQIECFLWNSLNGEQWCTPSEDEDHIKDQNDPANQIQTLIQFRRSTLEPGVLAIVFHDYYEKSGDYDDVYFTDDGPKPTPGSGRGYLSGRSNQANYYYQTIVLGEE